MEISQEDEPRNVVPRWRAAAALSKWEISPARHLPDLHQLTVDDFADDLEVWRQEGTLSAFVDIYDTGILLNDTKLQMEGAGPILSASQSVPTRLLDSVRRTFGRSIDYEDRKNRLTDLERRKPYIIATIRRLKKRLIDFPTDALSTIEMARHLVLLGQYDRADIYVRRALAIAPNSRTVLRAASQFYHIYGRTSEALPYLWKADSGLHDPLIQSAEVAIAEIAGKGSRFASSALKGLKGSKVVDVTQSELALAVATLELNAGAKQRKVFQLVRAGLPHGTENAVAQAVWLGDRTERSLQSRFPGLTLPDDAYEAKALTLSEQGKYQEALIEAKLWLRDQTFSPDAIVMICNISAIYLYRPSQALEVAKFGAETHSKD